jgi:mannosyltransferase
VLGFIQLLRNQPLWYDEAYSRLAARVPITTLLSGVWHRTGVISYLMDVPPSFNAPYYVLLHFWGSVAGTSEFALRLPSLWCAAAAVGVVAELVRRQAGPGAGLLCGLLCATGPLFVDEAVQARDYGPALLALALCALWFTDWLATGSGVRRMGIAAAAAGLLHWFTLPVLAGFAVAALLLRGRSGRRAATTIVVASAPAVLLVTWSLAGGTPGAPSPATVGLWLPVHAVRDWSQGLTALSIALTVAAVLGVWRSAHRVFALCWIVVPMLLITGLELVRPTYFARYLLFTLLGLIIAAALGIASLRSVPLRSGAAAVLLGLSVAATLPHLNDLPREPSPAAVRLLAAEQQAGQPIITADGRVSVDLETYLTLAPRLQQDLVLPPEKFTTQTSSRVVWLVRVVLKQNSLPVVPAEQRLLDAGWTEQSSTLLIGSNTDLRVERWTR